MSDSYSKVIDKIIAQVGNNIILGAPLGAGKPNHLINAIYARAKNDSKIRLTIATALTLEKPAGASLLEKRFMGPFADRVFGDYPNLQYEYDRQSDSVPNNIEILEFYFPPGKFLSNSKVQQNYISSNYTHVVRDMLDRKINVVVQMIAKGMNEDSGTYSLSCNADVTKDMREIADRTNHNLMIIGQVNQDLPFMYGEAQVEKSFFNEIIDIQEDYYPVFAPPKMSVPEIDFAIGLHASTLVKDDGELQVGIGSLGDSIIYSLILRHQQNEKYRTIITQMGQDQKTKDLIKQWGDLSEFKIGLFGATEMIVDGFMNLYQAGILKKKTFDNIPLQRLINEKILTPQFDKETVLSALINARIIKAQLDQTDVTFLKEWGILKNETSLELPYDLNSEQNYELIQSQLGDELLHGHIVHGGFFLGPRNFYEWLKSLSRKERKLFAMKSVQKINQLYGHEEIDRLQRKNARFINTCMMTTLSGAHVSDGLADGRVVSGVGGQYNFVAMAQELPDGRSILTMRSVRMSKGQLVSNIVLNYSHITVPRHMRDILVTEYGIANLRGKTDSEIIKSLLNIADSRFQEALLSDAKATGKIEKKYQIPATYRQNYPKKYLDVLCQYKNEGLFNPFPFGTDLMEEEKKIGKCLKALKKDKELGSLHMAGVIIKALLSTKDEKHNYLLKRMGLEKTSNFKEYLFQKLLSYKFKELRV